MTDTFPRRLSVAMDARGKSPRQVSDETGIAYNTVLCYRRGARNPTMHTIVALCRCLDVSADWLLGLERR